MDVLGSVVSIATGYRWTGRGILCFSDCLRVDWLGRVVVIATGYWWTCCGD